jgi:hypothetical protein
MATAVLNDLGIKVLTPSGYQDFSAINRIEQEARIKITLENGAILESSFNHPFKDKNGVFVLAKNFIVGEYIDTVDGLSCINSINLILENSALFDLLDVSNGNEYYTNGAISHNCEFLSSDPLLIESIRSLEMLRASMPPDYEEEQFKFWGLLDRARYLVGADVSEGLGKDYSTIEVFDAVTLEQVAEFRDQNTNEPELYDKLKWIFNKLISKKHPRTGKVPEVFWSYENNAQGKVISTLYDRDIAFPDVELISVGDKRGMNTNVSTKAEASKLFKKMVEQHGGLKVKSKPLVVELQNYVKATNMGTYKAKPGATDDLISSCLIVTRLLKYLSTYDDDAFDKLYRGAPAGESTDPSEEYEPLPMSF